MLDEKYFIIGIGLCIVIVIAAICVCVGIDAYTCHTKAEKQGLECEWGPIQGCMVKMPSGNWMDYDRLRYME